MALSLELRVGESVFIHAGDEKIEVKLTFKKGVRAKLGFLASKSVKIIRKNAVKKDRKLPLDNPTQG